MYDAIVVGSGFGGSMAAHRLIEAGWKVLLLERGARVRRGPHNREPRATLELTQHYSRESAYKVIEGGYGADAASVFCLGGPSVFYGGVSFRFREADFVEDPDVVGDSGSRWPLGYRDLEPFYDRAERLIGVAGDDSDDPTRPPRSAPFPHAPAPLARVSETVRDAARSLGLSPFPLPLAINHKPANGRQPCDACRMCDTYACSIEAKNDLAVAVIEPLERRGLEVRPDVVVNRLEWTGSRITGVCGWDRTRNESVRFEGRYVVMAAGALGSPHLLLASGLSAANPAGDAVGRYLCRHSCAMVFGFCNFRPDPAKV
ncbi:MAG: GMC family oxidoreductase, partial [Acidobacteria bacterium]